MRDELLTVAVVLVVVSAVVPLGATPGRAASPPAVPPTSPAVAATSDPVDPGTPTDVAVAFNVTGVVDPADVAVAATDVTGTVMNGSVGVDAGTTTLTFSPTSSGARRVGVTAFNSTGFTPVAETTVVSESGGNVTIDGYSVSKTTVDRSENFWVNTSLSNGGSVAENFTVVVYGADGTARDLANATREVPASGSANVNLTVNYSTSPYTGAVDLTVNNESSTSMTVNTGSGGGGGSLSISAPDVTTTTGSTVDVTVSYDVTGTVTGDDANVTLHGPNGLIAAENVSTASGSVTFTLPSRAASGAYRIRAAVSDDTLTRQYGTLSPVVKDVFVANVTGAVTPTGYTLNRTELVAGESLEATVGLANSGGSSATHALYVYGSAGSYEPIGNRTVTVPGGATTTATVGATYPANAQTGDHELTVGNASSTTVRVTPFATVQSYSVLSGPKNASNVGLSIEPPSSEGGLLQFDVEDPQKTWAQNLSGTGLTNQSRIEVVLRVNHTYEPAVAIATGTNATWQVSNRSTYYEVTVTAEPIDSQFTSNASSVEDWKTLPAAQDKAEFAFQPMYSLAFVSRERVDAYNPNMSGMLVATDAQAFNPPRYDTSGSTPFVEIGVAGPHETVDGTNNTGRFEARLPSALLSQWGVSSPSELTAEYAGTSRSLNPTTNPDGSIDIGFDTHYSAETVEVAPDTPSTGGSAGTETGGDGGESNDWEDDDDDDGSTTGDATPPGGEPTATSGDDETTTATTPNDATTETPASTPETETRTGTATPTSRPTATSTPAPTARPEETDGSPGTSRDGPGFGVLVALVAVVVAPVWARRRE